MLKCTHCLADTCVACLIDATYKDPTGEGDVEAEVDQHVPELGAHTDRPGSDEHTKHHRMKISVPHIMMQTVKSFWGQKTINSVM